MNCKHTHLLFQVCRQEGLFALLQEEDDHEGEDVGRQPALLSSVDHADLENKWVLENKTSCFTQTTRSEVEPCGGDIPGPNA